MKNKKILHCQKNSKSNRKTKKYYTVGRIPNLIEKQKKYHTVRRIPNLIEKS
jgi:hypothetical protein